MRNTIPGFGVAAGFVLAMGSEKLTNTPGGPLLSRRFTNVWRAEGGSWRLVIRQATLIG